MAKPQFQNIGIDCWEHRGKLGLAQSSLCLFHDKIEKGGEIVVALDELRSDGATARRSLGFKPSRRERAIATLRLLLVPEREELRVMHIACGKGMASIEMTPIGLEVVREQVVAWLAGGEDFGVDPRMAGMKKRELGPLDLSSAELWFWGPTYSEP